MALQVLPDLGSTANLQLYELPLTCI